MKYKRVTFYTRTLNYFCAPLIYNYVEQTNILNRLLLGPFHSVPLCAQTLPAAPAQNCMQTEINNSWLQLRLNMHGLTMGTECINKRTFSDAILLFKD